MAKQQAPANQPATQSNQDVDTQKTPGTDVDTLTPATDESELTEAEYADYLKEKYAKKRDELVSERESQVPDSEEETTGSLDV